MPPRVPYAQQAPQAGPVLMQTIAAPPEYHNDRRIQLSIGGMGPQHPVASFPMHRCWPEGHPCEQTTARRGEFHR